MDKAVKKYLARRRSRMDARRFDIEWEENAHPRDKSGKFTSGGGGGGAPQKKPSGESAVKESKGSTSAEKARENMINRIERPTWKKTIDRINDRAMKDFYDKRSAGLGEEWNFLTKIKPGYTVAYGINEENTARKTKDGWEKLDKKSGKWEPTTESDIIDKHEEDYRGTGYMQAPSVGYWDGEKVRY